MIKFGVDEAGKGPVIGPMVASAVACTEQDLPQSVSDSKKLTPTKREAIYDEVCSNPNISVGVVVVSPEEIDDPTSNMNDLALNAHVKAVSEVALSGMTGGADACDVDARRYAEKFRHLMPFAVNLIAKHKADETNPWVSTASVVAKVTRDELVQDINDMFKINIGSGYPSDVTTREFLEVYYRENGEFPASVRTSWSTCSKIARKVDMV